MEILKTFQIPNEGAPREKTIREACRIVMFDENKLMPLLFVGKDNYHKLPGGGIDKDEERMDALKREALEETGCEINVTKEIGSVIEQNDFWEQRSYCYLGEVIKKGVPEFTLDEAERGFELKWVNIDEAIHLIKADTTSSEAGKRIQQRDLFIVEKAKERL